MKPFIALNRNGVEIIYMPVYHPSDAEKADPDLFAENVRLQMSHVLGQPCTEFSFESLQGTKTLDPLV